MCPISRFCTTSSRAASFCNSSRRCTASTRTHAARAIDREIERFELGEFVDELTERYSHGMKQRTVFASALLNSPRVLVVDEPMVGLDPHSIRLVKDLLCAEGQGGHVRADVDAHAAAAEEISHRVGIMSHGKLMFDGTIDELRERFPGGQQSLESMYLAMTRGAAARFARQSLASGPT